MNNYYLLGCIYTDEFNFKKELFSKILITYKCNFPEICKTKITNDIGWGCTIRSGQMLLANTLLRNHLNLYNKTIEENTVNINEYKKIISYFNDNYNSIFSLHNFTNYYEQMDIIPGNWVGPYSFCKILEYYKDVLYKHNICYMNCINGELNLKSIQINNKNNINNTNNTNISYLFTFPIRLGITEINSEYYRNILYYTKSKYFNGIIGGNKTSSFYFVGSVNSKLIYLDPHYVSKYNLLQNIEEYYTKNINYLDIKNLSPTFSICFYCKNFNEISELINILKFVPDKKNSIIEVTEYELKSECNTYTIQEAGEQWEFIE